jgi:hypothetical protein
MVTTRTLVQASLLIVTLAAATALAVVVTAPGERVPAETVILPASETTAPPSCDIRSAPPLLLFLEYIDPDLDVRTDHLLPADMLLSKAGLPADSDVRGIETPSREAAAREAAPWVARGYAVVPVPATPTLAWAQDVVGPCGAGPA